jgi:hypothetical protein
MSDPRVSDLQFYPVVPGRPVHLSVVVGNAQSGGTSASFRGTVVRVPEEGISVGAAGDDLRGAVLHCVTTVRDINPASDMTMVTYTLRGGVEDQTFPPYNVPVSASGGHARYEIDFAFV